MIFKKKSLIVAFFTLLILAILTYQSTKGESHISDIISYPLKILEQGSSVIIKSVKSFFKAYVLIVGKEEENRRLLNEINRFEEEKNKYIEAQHENERLRKLLKLRSERVNYITASDVFARDPTNWFQVLWINKGRNDGISKDMIAVTPIGPVGRIYRVLNDRASIILITDVNSSVAVRIQPSRIEGILEGRGDNRCYLKYVSREADVRAGQRIITSGLDGIYPAGFLIGYVSGVRKKKGELFQQIEVMPAQNLNAIEEVAILKR